MNREEFVSIVTEIGLSQDPAVYANLLYDRIMDDANDIYYAGYRKGRVKPVLTLSVIGILGTVGYRKLKNRRNRNETNRLGNG